MPRFACSLPRTALLLQHPGTVNPSQRYPLEFITSRLELDEHSAIDLHWITAPTLVNHHTPTHTLQTLPS